jgi:hypothetical protein
MSVNIPAIRDIAERAIAIHAKETATTDAEWDTVYEFARVSRSVIPELCDELELTKAALSTALSRAAAAEAERDEARQSDAESLALYRNARDRFEADLAGVQAERDAAMRQRAESDQALVDAIKAHGITAMQRDQAIREQDGHLAGAEECRAALRDVKSALGLLGGGIGLSCAEHVRIIVAERDSLTVSHEWLHERVRRLEALEKAAREWKVTFTKRRDAMNWDAEEAWTRHNLSAAIDALAPAGGEK